jgi:ATP-binding cassette subfamily B protein/subfamily B ATP-binding cassette protein MsbA
LFLHCFLSFIIAAGTLLFMAVAMARRDLRLTGVALVAVPILLLSIKVFGRAMRERGTVAQQAESKIYALIHQGITALPLIQSHARENHERQRFIAHTEEARHHKMAQQGLEVFYWGSISVILSACTLGVTWVGAQQVLAANLTVGELLVFLAYVAQLFDPLHQLSQVRPRCRARGARVGCSVLDTPEEVKKPAGRVRSAWDATWTVGGATHHGGEHVRLGRGAPPASAPRFRLRQRHLRRRLLRL